MTPHLRDRILRKLETLNDDRGYQVLDYVEFLESRYAEKSASSTSSLFQRFTEGVEDTLRVGKVSTTAIAETMGLMNKAMGVLSGVAAAGKSVASDIATAASQVTRSAPSGETAGHPVAPAPPTNPVPPADDVGAGTSAPRPPAA